MSHRPTIVPFANRVMIPVLYLMLWLAALTALGQAPQSSGVRELLPNQSIEREMTGAETHRYKIDLKANEFFQVRVEQRGVDVVLRLSDASGNVLATMDSPNSKEGPETLSFVATVAGNYKLEVSAFDTKAEKGKYTIRRETSRTATANDRRRIEADTAFAEAKTLVNEGSAKSKRTSLPRFNEARSLYQELGDKQSEANCLHWLGNVQSAMGEQQHALKSYNLALPIYRAVGDRREEALTLNHIGLVYAALGEQQQRWSLTILPCRSYELSGINAVKPPRSTTSAQSMMY